MQMYAQMQMTSVHTAARSGTKIDGNWRDFSSSASSVSNIDAEQINI